MTTIADEIMEAVNKMTEAEQRKLLATIKGEDISSYGIPIEEFMARSRELNFDPSFCDAVDEIVKNRVIDDDEIEPLNTVD